LQRRGGTFFRVSFQATKDDALDQGIKIADQSRRIGDGPGLALLHQFRERCCFEGAFARQDFVEDEAEGIEIALGADIAAGQVARGPVCGSSRADVSAFDACGDAGEAKIGDTDLASSVEHHIRGFQVAVDDAAFVSRCKASADLPGNLRGFVRREPANPANDRSEIFSIHVLHREEKNAVGFADVKTCGRHWDEKPAGQCALRRETGQARRHPERVPQGEISKPRPVPASGLRTVDFAHSSAAREGYDAVALRDDLSGRKTPAADGVGTR